MQLKVHSSILFLWGGASSVRVQSGGNNIGRTAAAIIHSGVIISTMQYGLAAWEREWNTQVRKEARQQSAQQEEEERCRERERGEQRAIPLISKGGPGP